jgi:hypothetical protein
MFLEHILVELTTTIILILLVLTHSVRKIKINDLNEKP